MDYEKLEDIWNTDHSDSNYFNKSIRPEINNIINQKSGDLMEKLKRKILTETILTIALIAVVLITTRENATLYPMLMGVSALVIVSLLPYYKLWSQMNVVQELDIMKSMDLRIKIVKSFIKSLKRFVWVVTSLAMLLGLWLVLFESGKYDMGAISYEPIIVIGLATLAIVFAIAGILNKIYIPKQYGTAINDLIDMKKELEAT
jgi:hypothetical protein